MVRVLLVVSSLTLLACKAHHPALPIKTGVVPSTTLEYPSGLRVVFEQHPGSQRLAVALLVGAGAANDPPGRAGLAHLIEHLAFRSRPSHRLTASDELEFAGVSSVEMTQANASTTLNDTVFSGIVAADRAPAVLPLISSLVVQPLLDVDDAAIELERSIVRNERLLRSPHGGGDIDAAVRQVALGDRSESIIGTEKSLGDITRADLEKFVAERYRPHSLTVVLVGDLDPKRIDGLIRASFPPAWLAAGPQGPQRPVQLFVEDPGIGMMKSGISVPPPPPEMADAPVVEAPVLRRQLIFAWPVPGLTQTAGRAMPLLMSQLRWRFRNVGKDLGVTGVWADFIGGPRTSVLTLNFEVESTAKLADVRRAVREGQLGPFWSDDLRDLTMERLTDEQHLLMHAENRARYIFTTGSTKPERVWNSSATYDVLRALDKEVLTWDRAREVDVMPMVESNVVPPLPPAQTVAPRQVMVTKEMLESIALPLPLPNVRRFTLPNGLQVVLSQRGPVPVAVVTLALPAGARNTTRGVSALTGKVIQWWPRRRPPPAKFGRPLFAVTADTTFVQLSSVAWELPLMLDVLGHNTTPKVIWGGAERLERGVEDFLDQNEKREPDPDRPRPTAALHRKVLPEGSTLLPVTFAEATSLPERDFVDFLALAFRPNGAVLTIDGDIDFDGTEAIVRELFSDWEKREPKARPLRALGKVPPKPAAPEVIDGKSSPLTRVRFACRLPPAATVEMRGANMLLAEALELTFENELRKDRGLTYGVGASATAARNEDNVLSFSATLDPRGGQAALVQFFRKFDELDGAVWDEGQVDLARWRTARKNIASGGTSLDVTERLAYELALGAAYEQAVAVPRQLAAAPLKWVDEAWAACSDSLALEVEGDRRSIERVLKARAK
jgi:zinc protease